jgi:hypothetical protein
MGSDLETSRTEGPVKGIQEPGTRTLVRSDQKPRKQESRRTISRPTDTKLSIEMINRPQEEKEKSCLDEILR